MVLIGGADPNDGRLESVAELAGAFGVPPGDVVVDATGRTTAEEADVIMLRTDRINVLPINDPIGVVVRGMDSSNVDSVFIAGRARKRGGKLLDVDLTSIHKLVTESRDYVVSASGFKLPDITRAVV